MINIKYFRIVNKKMKRVYMYIIMYLFQRSWDGAYLTLRYLCDWELISRIVEVLKEEFCQILA